MKQFGYNISILKMIIKTDYDYYTIQIMQISMIYLYKLHIQIKTSNNRTK